MRSVVEKGARRTCAALVHKSAPGKEFHPSFAIPWPKMTEISHLLTSSGNFGTVGVGFLNESGRPFNPKCIAAMVA